MHPTKESSEGPEQNQLLVTLISSPLPADPSGSQAVQGDPLLARLRAPRQYSLKVVDPSGCAAEKILPVPGTGALTLARWKISVIHGRRLLSAFFYINSAGHDLDTWIHFDLETGQVLGMHPGSESDPEPASRLVAGMETTDTHTGGQRSSSAKR
jgi:hypothetical protein